MDHWLKASLFVTIINRNTQESLEKLTSMTDIDYLNEFFLKSLARAAIIPEVNVPDLGR